ncbi:FixH family protein [Sutcliffiella halmapala]|uniref:FixH family protein n=1 Tax=Sutcliffiella halmapala TaxID=79882 RepID=UPI0014744796|nr:FixH family protein [Sutcliffiella halmapala]
MKNISLILVTLGIFLMGCTSVQEEEVELTVINVDIQLPEKVQTNQSIELKTHVRQGEENVEDAQEVQFEIWNVEKGKEASKLVEISHQRDGIYQVEEVFEKEGIYRVQAHVTARGMHVMPTKQLVVGDLSQEEIERILGEESNKEEESPTDDGNHH